MKKFKDLTEDELIYIHTKAHDAVEWNKDVRTTVVRDSMSFVITSNFYRTSINNTYGYIITSYNGLPTPLYNIFEIVKYCQSLGLDY